MTLIEAVKSGKRFRRTPGKCPHVSLDEICTCREWYENRNDRGYRLLFKPTDILADDWEIEEARVTITRADLERAFVRASNECNHTYLKAGELFDWMVRELGL